MLLIVIFPVIHLSINIIYWLELLSIDSFLLDLRMRFIDWFFETLLIGLSFILIQTIPHPAYIIVIIQPQTLYQFRCKYITHRWIALFNILILFLNLPILFLINILILLLLWLLYRLHFHSLLQFASLLSPHSYIRLTLAIKLLLYNLFLILYPTRILPLFILTITCITHLTLSILSQWIKFYPSQYFVIFIIVLPFRLLSYSLILTLRCLKIIWYLYCLKIISFLTKYILLWYISNILLTFYHTFFFHIIN